MLQKILHNFYYMLNFINKNVEIYLLSYYVRIYLISLILPLGSQCLKYLLSDSLQKIFANPPLWK